MPTSIKLKWGKEEYDIEIESGSTVEVFKTQVWTITTVPVDRQKFLGFPGGVLKDADDLDAKVAKLKPGAKITLLGTAEGGELKKPTEKVVFEEDLTAEEKAKILKERKVDIMPAGIKNLGNTCYMNSTVQCLCKIKELTAALQSYQMPGADARDIDAVFTNQLKIVSQELTQSVDAIAPFQFVQTLKTKFPRFGEMQNGHPMQQDADECLRGILQTLSTCLSTSGSNRIDELFGFKMKSSLKCLECDEEPPTSSEEIQRVLICHLGTQTDPVSHIYQGVQLSLKEHIEKNSVLLGRNAQYEKSAALASLPPYLIVQFARFGYKGANDWAGTAASKVKLIRQIKFSPTFDMYDLASEELKKTLSAGRLKHKDQEDAKTAAATKQMFDEEKKKMEKGPDPTNAMSAEDKAMSSSAPAAMEVDDDVEMKAASAVGVEEIDTGYYELVGIISHKGRSADGGHYVGWTLLRKADKEMKDDIWICYDDETVTQWTWKDISGISMDLQGGRADTQISYINIYKKVTASIDIGVTLGDGEAAASSSAPYDGDKEMPAASGS